MNPLMLKQEEEQLKKRLDAVQQLTTRPLRYIEYCQKFGTALGQTYKLKPVKSKAA